MKGPGTTLPVRHGTIDIIDGKVGKAVDVTAQTTGSSRVFSTEAPSLELPFRFKKMTTNTNNTLPQPVEKDMARVDVKVVQDDYIKAKILKSPSSRSLRIRRTDCKDGKNLQWRRLRDPDRLQRG